MIRGLSTVLVTVCLAALACVCAGWLSAAASAAGSHLPVGALASAGGPVDPAPPPLNDLLGTAAREATLDLSTGLGALGALPTARETAAFAAGRVAVGVVFVESDGWRTASSESWSLEDPRWPGQDRRRLVLGQVRDALDWWNARSPDGSLELFLPETGTYGSPRTLATGYEPIQMAIEYGYGGKKSVLSDAPWRWEVMGRLGFGHDVSDDKPMPERLYADRLRSRTGADWAFVLYVVDSLRDADGRFRNDMFAYTADLFGPYMVLTYDNDGYGFANFGAVMAHEMGHVFGALDEYEPPNAGYPSTGNLASGYLGILNSNAVRGGTTNLPCIMRGSNATLSAFKRGQLCPSTIGQAGLRDSDLDSRPDVVDTSPRLTLGAPVANPDGGLQVIGSVRERPWPRGRITKGVYFHRDISILVPHDLVYRLDGGAWQPLAAADGAFDEPSERWLLTLGSLVEGEHLLEVQATTGGAAGASKVLAVGPPVGSGAK